MFNYMKREIRRRKKTKNFGSAFETLTGWILGYKASTINQVMKMFGQLSFSVAKFSHLSGVFSYLKYLIKLKLGL